MGVIFYFLHFVFPEIVPSVRRFDRVYLIVLKRLNILMTLFKKCGTSSVTIVTGHTPSGNGILLNLYLMDGCSQFRVFLDVNRRTFSGPS